MALLATFVLVQTPNIVSDAQRRRPPRPLRAASTPIAAAKYSTFTHHTHGPDGQDARAKLLKCSDCHTLPPVVEATTPAPATLTDPLKSPYHDAYHDACFGCHEREIYRGARPPICSVCHSRVSPRATAGDVKVWQFVTAKFNHLGGRAQHDDKKCGECHYADPSKEPVKFPKAPIAACLGCHRSNNPRILTEIDKYEDVLQGKALKPNEPRECVGCHLPEVGKRPPPCSHFKLFGYDYFDAEYPQIAKELSARREKKSCTED